jgi:hypothetical protein
MCMKYEKISTVKGGIKWTQGFTKKKVFKKVLLGGRNLFQSLIKLLFIVFTWDK